MRSWAAAMVLTPAALWVVLALNEVFLNPPLLTPRITITPEMTGAWSDGAITMRIAEDGTVAGEHGKRALEGRLEGNRTWFGRRMNWRTDYRIRGQLEDGRPVPAPMNWTGTSYRGGLAVGPNYKANAWPLELTRRTE